jgi:hypothetical protein
MKDIKIPENVYPVLACLPADPKTWDRAGLVHVIVPKTYIKGTCSECSCEVYMGPTQQEFIKKHPETIIQCFECTIKIMGTGNIAGVAALQDNSDRETCTMFTKKGKILGPRNSNN